MMRYQRIDRRHRKSYPPIIIKIREDDYTYMLKVDSAMQYEPGFDRYVANRLAYAKARREFMTA